MQPCLFDNSWSRWQRLLSLLLWHANSKPAHKRYQFYDMKERILRRYGTIDSGQHCDWQDVSKPCWSCDGTGGLYEPGACLKCFGTGIYRPVFVPLARWKLAGRVFHLPGEAQSREPETGVQIKGYVRHAPSRYAWIAELLLAVVFDRKLAKSMLLSRPPLAWMSHIRRSIRTLKAIRFPRCYQCGRIAWRRRRHEGYCSYECWSEGIPF